MTPEPAPLYVAVDLENLEGRLGGVFGLLGRLDADGAELLLVGGERAQRDLARYRVPAAWEAAAEVVCNDAEPAAADRVITDCIDESRGPGHVIVLASRDGGFDRILRRASSRGSHVFVLGVEGTAVRLREACAVLPVEDPADVAHAAAVIAHARTVGAGESSADRPRV